jgi:heavy metal translocating P-type ATPase
MKRNGSGMGKNILKFFKQYKKLGVVLVLIVLGAILDVLGKDVLAHWVLGAGAAVAAVPLIWDMWQTVKTGGFGIDILAATAIVTSILLGEYWAGAVIALMLTSGEALEDYAERRAKSELSALLTKRPKLAHLQRGSKIVDVKASDVTVGDKVVVYPGEVVPVDGQIIEGASSLDESSLTGESLPIAKSSNDLCLSGSVNIEGAITIKAIRAASDSQYEQIIKLVKSASANQSPFVRIADRYSMWFTIVSFIIAGSAWVVSGDSLRFLQVLVVATPCPLLLGAPIALISGMSRAAKHGIIIKTGSAIEKLASIETIAFDKTGTLTAGTPVITKVETFGSNKKNDVLAVAAALEQSSTHVLANAIVTAAEKAKVKVQKAKHIKEHSGLGLHGRIGGKDVKIGRLQYMLDSDIDMPKGWKQSSVTSTTSFVSINNSLAGILHFSDPVRTEAKSMLSRIKKSGIKHSLMVTGDNQKTADTIAKQLGITDVQANCLPADKIHAIERVTKKPVAFVGDGVNDAPVLTASDIGIALGARGSTAASESADVVIMLDDVSKVADGVEIAQRTFSIARQSILIGILISLGLMGVFATGKFKPVYGAALQEVVDVVVIINALRAHGGGKKSKS